MHFINGYQYNTEENAIIAQKACNMYYGIPVSPTDITQNWVDYHLAELNTPQFWYIIYDESLLPILGQPQQFEIIQPNPSI
jgi:hypothetical protein